MSGVQLGGGRAVRRRTILLALLLLVVASIATGFVVGLTGAAGPRLELDENTPLMADATVDTYEQEGVVDVELDRVAMTVTVADTHDQADLDGMHADEGVTYLCLDYREDLSRTIRLYVDGDLVSPRAAELSPVGGEGPAATLASVQNGSATAVTVTFDQAGRHCYAVGALRGYKSSGESWSRKVIGNFTGVELPSLAGSDSDAAWSYINASRVRPNETLSVPADATVQYDRDPGPGAPAWVTAPGCEDGEEQAICQLSLHNETMLKVTDSRDLRYRTTPAGPIEGLQSNINDAIQAAQDAVSALRTQLSEVL